MKNFTIILVAFSFAIVGCAQKKSITAENFYNKEWRIVYNWFGADEVLLEHTKNGNWFKVNPQGNVQFNKRVVNKNNINSRPRCPVGETRKTIHKIERVKNRLMIHYKVTNYKQFTSDEKIWYQIESLNGEQLKLKRIEKS